MFAKCLTLAVSAVAAFSILGVTTPDPFAQEASSVVLDETLLEGYRWRNLGPDRGGRSIAVSGVIGQPEVAYFGAVGGGLWKTTDGGDYLCLGRRRGGQRVNPGPGLHWYR